MTEIKKEDFKHFVQVRVRTWEVDWQGIVHNSNYLRYMEIGRLEYRRSYGYDLCPNGTFNDGLKVFVVHNSVDYVFPARLDEVLNVYTRVSWIKNSSFCFEHLVENAVSGKILATGKGIIVNVNFDTDVPERLPDKFVNEVKNYEFDCKILRD